MKAVICPVCNGKGVIYGIAETGAFPTTTCHGCNGKGWVEVNDNYFATSNPYPYPGNTYPFYQYYFPYQYWDV